MKQTCSFFFFFKYILFIQDQIKLTEQRLSATCDIQHEWHPNLAGRFIYEADGDLD